MEFQNVNQVFVFNIPTIKTPTHKLWGNAPQEKYFLVSRPLPPPLAQSNQNPTFWGAGLKEILLTPLSVSGVQLSYYFMEENSDFPPFLYSKHQ